MVITYYSMKLSSLYVKALWHTLANTQLIFLKKSICMLLKIVLPTTLHMLNFGYVLETTWSPAPVCLFQLQPWTPSSRTCLCNLKPPHLLDWLVQHCFPSDTDLLTLSLQYLSTLLLSLSLLLAEITQGIWSSLPLVVLTSSLPLSPTECEHLLNSLQS